MLYLINPKRKRARAGKTRKRRFSRKQLAAQRRFAAMARARAKAARRGTRRAPSRGGSTMARRRKRAAASRQVRRRRSPVSARRRRFRLYAANPKRRRVRRRSYRRNPSFGAGILGKVQDTAVGAGVALVGAGVGRTVSNLIPIGDGSPIANFAKGAVVAIGIRIFGERVVGRDMARIAAIGALLLPTRDLIVSFVPGAQTFLGQPEGVMYLPGIPAGRRLSAYPADLSPVSVIAEDTGSLGSYAGGSGFEM